MFITSPQIYSYQCTNTSLFPSFPSYPHSDNVQFPNSWTILATLAIAAPLLFQIVIHPTLAKHDLMQFKCTVMDLSEPSTSINNF